jgi:N-acetylmuramoyl-L-alanine amidase
MITAEQARNLMPNIGETLKVLENKIGSAAGRGETNITHRWSKTSVIVKNRVKSILVELGYSISETERDIKISWKKL